MMCSVFSWHALMVTAFIYNIGGIKIESPSKRVLNSLVVTKHSIPYQADLIIQFPTSETLYRTGTLISRNYLLTTASNVVGSSDIAVVMGVYNVEDKEEPTRRTYSGESYTAYPLYTRPGYHDIAVVRLNQSAEINDYVQLATLPRYNHGFNYPLIGKAARVSGWGNVNADSDLEHSILRYAVITIRHHSECRPQFKYTFKGQLCSTDATKLFEISDIGAPLVINNVQVGIAAATNMENGTEKSPQVYTRIDRYLLWLNSVTDAIISW